MWRKKLPCDGQPLNWAGGSQAYLMQFISGRQDDGWQQKIEEHLVVEADRLADGGDVGYAQDQADEHAGKDGEHRLMHGLYFPGLEDIAGEQSDDQQSDQNRKPP